MRRGLQRRLAACLAVCFAVWLGAVPAAMAVEAPGTTMFVIDTSGSMRGVGMSSVRDAVEAYTRVAGDTHPFGLIVFGERARVVLPAGATAAQLRKAVRGLNAVGDTAMFDALVLAQRELAGTDDARIVLISDGADTTSTASRATVTRQLREGDAVLSAIAFRTNDLQLDVLRALATAGRGTVVAARDAATLAAALQDIAPPVTPTPTPTASASPSPGRTVGQWPVRDAIDLRIAVPLLLVIVLGVAAGGLLLLIDREREARHDITHMLQDFPGSQLARTGEERSTGYQRLREALAQWLEKTPRGKRLATRLDGAGITLPVVDWTLMHVLGPVLLAALGAALGGWPVALLLMIVGIAAPFVYLNQVLRRRRVQFESGLPDLLMLVASSLRAGFSVEHSIAAACERASSRVAVEFNRAVREVRLGGTLDEALERMAQRTGSRDMFWIVSALRIQRRTGGNMAELMSTSAKTVRERAQIAREVNSLTAEGRMSATVLIMLPIGLGLFMQLTRPEYMAPMYTTTIGRIMLGLAIGLVGSGWLVLKQLTKVEV